jgi:hypothetical protein
MCRQWLGAVPVSRTQSCQLPDMLIFMYLCAEWCMRTCMLLYPCINLQMLYHYIVIFELTHWAAYQYMRGRYIMHIVVYLKSQLQLYIFYMFHTYRTLFLNFVIIKKKYECKTWNTVFSQYTSPSRKLKMTSDAQVRSYACSVWVMKVLKKEQNCKY